MKKISLLLGFCILYFLPGRLSAQTLYESYIFKGTIGAKSIVLTFLVSDHFYNYDQGSYYYTKQKKKIGFRGPDFSEIGADSTQKMIETVNGKKTGYFVFTNLDVMSPKKIIGKWYSMDGKTSFPVVLKFDKTKDP